MKSEYRGDIDGLRAIAVLAVFLFHLGIEAVGGGFVGVDVFFVISGFLITQILTRDIRGGFFTLGEFYSRRIRRLLPAFFVVSVTTSLFALVFYTPDELTDYTKNLLASSLFSANLWFMLNSGYFDGAAEQNALLHMWSLGVEEQFYLFFPLVLVFAFRWGGKGAAISVGGLAALSFGYGIYLLAEGLDNRAFFFSPARFWELLVGCIAALFYGRVSQAPIKIAHLLAFLGISLILIPIFTFDDAIIFPGFAAAVPVFGAAFLLVAGPRTFVAAVLTKPPFRLVGLVSYSLYLWHWPVIHFYQRMNVVPLKLEDHLIIFLIATILAVVSYRCVEIPFRYGKLSGFIPPFRATLAVPVLFAMFMAVVVLSDGLPWRVPDEVNDYLEAARSKWPSECKISNYNDVKLRSCEINSKVARPIDFVVWGDSHATALMPAFEMAARDKSLRGKLFSKGGCPGLLGIAQKREGFYDCPEKSSAVLDYILNNGVKTVYLVSRWGLYANGVRYRSEPGAHVILQDESGRGGSLEENSEILMEALLATTQQLKAHDVRIIFVHQVPEVEYDSSTIAYAEYMGESDNLRPYYKHYLQRHSKLYDAFKSRRELAMVNVFNPADTLCGSLVCKINDGNLPYYEDTNHLSIGGALALAEDLAKTM